MTNRSASAPAIIAFLRQTLASGAIGVPELQTRARAAGLLGDQQCMTHAKSFKKAKRSLGIRSARTGFGDAGKWVWSLTTPAAPVAETSQRPPVRSPTVSNTNAEVQRQRFADKDPPELSEELRVPSDWTSGVASLDDHHRPVDILPHRWRQFMVDCNKFVVAAENGAGRAAELGWDTLALFGCHRDRPGAHLGAGGLIWAIDGGRLVKLHPDWAVIDLVTGSERVFTRRRLDAAKFTLPWIGRRQPSGR